MKIGQIIKRKQSNTSLKNKVVWSGIICIALFGLIGGASLAAAQGEFQSETSSNVAGYYTKDGKTSTIMTEGDIRVTRLVDLSPSEIEALYPMSSEEEAKIIHIVPSSPIIIDGTQYKPEEIHLFDGIRLRFVAGKDGNLYAFTTAKRLEAFQSEYQSESLISSSGSIYYMDMWYTGNNFELLPGYGFPYLSDLGFDNAVSSVKATPSASWTYIYDYTNFQGDYFAMAGGTNYGMLFFQGWNDRASSAYVTSY